MRSIYIFSFSKYKNCFSHLCIVILLEDYEIAHEGSSEFVES